MTNEPPKFRYYRVEGPALEVLKAYKTELEALVDDRQKLEEEFAKRAQQQGEYHQANLQALWRRLAASVGLDPKKTWGSPEFQVEVRYLNDGFGAILYMPRHINPARDMLQGEPIAEPENPETDIPPKETTRH